jgi:PIN domain nuclease of toxin-antitoxin system
VPVRTAFFRLRRQVIEVEALLRSGGLPPGPRDPFDRLLAAQSLVHGLVVVTPDAPIAVLGAPTCW